MDNLKLQTYMNMSSVPAGAILNSLIETEGYKKSEIARAASLLPQRINDLIMGNRRFTVEISAGLEKSLGINIPGFFYLIQAQNDVYKYIAENKAVRTPDLSKLTETTFWDTDLKKVDWDRCSKWAIRRVLEYGNDEELKEMQNFYGKDTVKDIALDPTGFRVYSYVQRKINTMAL